MVKPTGESKTNIEKTIKNSLNRWKNAEKNAQNLLKQTVDILINPIITTYEISKEL